MNLFDRNYTRKSIATTEGFYFGKSESEGENSYNKDSSDTLFADYLDILPMIEKGYFIITGRKGSGKSAIAKYIKDNASANELLFCEIIKSDTIKLEQQIQDSFSNSEDRLISFFQWLILVKLVKLILESKNGEYTSELKALNNFVKNNRGIVDIDKFSITEVKTISKQEVNLGSLINSPIFKAIIERVIGKRMEKAPYYKLLPALKEIVYKILSFPVFEDYKFVVIFDDLDIGFKSGSDQDKQSLMELIRTAKEINNDLKEIGNTQILILLRDDIKKILEGFSADVSKIFSSYEVELKWHDGKKESDTRLRKFVNRRIEANFKQKNIKYQAYDPWITLFKDDEGCYGTDYNEKEKTAFKQILDYTFYRPRDLILFLKNVGTNKYYYPINGQNISELLQKYATENVSEIKSELAIHYSQSQITDIFKVLRSLSYSQSTGYSKDTIIAELQNQNLDSNIFFSLVDYYIILPFDSTNGKYYIGYRNSNMSDYDVNKETIMYKLHKCIYAYFVPRSTMPNNI